MPRASIVLVTLCSMHRHSRLGHIRRLESVVAGVSDHEGALRKGLRVMGVDYLGCACHALQLPMKHILPALRKRKRASSSSSSSKSSSTSSIHEPPSPEAAPSPEDEQPPACLKRPLDPERDEIRAEMEPLFKKGRKLISKYVNNPDMYNAMMKTAEDQ